MKYSHTKSSEETIFGVQCLQRCLSGHVTHVGVVSNSCMASGLRSVLGSSTTIDPSPFSVLGWYTATHVVRDSTGDSRCTSQGYESNLRRPAASRMRSTPFRSVIASFNQCIVHSSCIRAMNIKSNQIKSVPWIRVWVRSGPVRSGPFREIGRPVETKQISLCPSS